MQDGGPIGLDRPQEPETARGAFTCQVDVRGGNLTCKAEAASLPAGASGVILGGQGTYVLLASTNVKYDAGAEVFSADVTVRNLLTQALGTADGTNLHPDGVRVFFHTAPAVTQGTGVVTVKNADGTAVFTGSSTPYFQYSQVLSPGKVSLPRTWEWNVPSTVGTFTFTVYVSAAAPQETVIEPGLRIDVRTITSGNGYSCGLTPDGKAWCWGRGVQGQLGNGSTDDQLTPVEVSASGATFVSISAGNEFTCAVTSAGKAYCWGSNWAGQLGDGSTTDRSTPVAVAAPTTATFVSISAGSHHACAVTTTGGPTAGATVEEASSATVQEMIRVRRSRSMCRRVRASFRSAPETIIPAQSPPPARPTAGATVTLAGSAAGQCWTSIPQCRLLHPPARASSRSAPAPPIRVR